MATRVSASGSAHQWSRPADELRCVTVRQPWASAIALGAKLVENRTRSTSYRGLVGIHAGRAWAPGGVHDDRCQSALVGARPLVDPEYEFGLLGLPMGAVIAVAALVDCHRAAGSCCGPWGDPDCWHLVLEDIRSLPMPVPAKGSLALPWAAPEDVAARVMGQMVEAAGGGRMSGDARRRRPPRGSAPK